jgi:glycosyltransferase involved in cell wall biosynthesis
VARILVVSSYPPRHCGIGAYAHAQVQRLRDEGHDVTMLSAPDGEGDIRAELIGGEAFARAAAIGSGFDRVIVHFQPALYYPPRAAAAKIRTSLRLLSLVRRVPQTEIVVHEADPPIRWRPDYVLLRQAFSRARLLFHTDIERDRFERAYRIRARAELIPHTEGVEVTGVSREDARYRLGIPPEERLFLCAGFLGPSKGFERAVEAWNMAGMPGRLVIVGSVRDDTPENLAYAAMLRELVAGHDRLQLVEDYVADDEFDAWVAGADLLILPYRRSWSSGALARAQRHGTPAAVADVGGLAEQAGPNDVVFHSDGELVKLLVDRVGAVT